MVIVHFEAGDLEKAFETVATSKDPFMVWFKQQVSSVIGVDLEQSSDQPPREEIVHMWQESRMTRSSVLQGIQITLTK